MTFGDIRHAANLASATNWLKLCLIKSGTQKGGKIQVEYSPLAPSKFFKSNSTLEPTDASYSM